MPPVDDVPAPRADPGAARAIAETTLRALLVRHPATDPRTVEAVVLQAAWELAAHARVPHAFGRQLRTRAEARLLAMAGTLTPLRRAAARD
ncbi:hypothetical protein [Actinokineospora bangkokensis]|uniref:Uncharacterized protein n=1 Tax=Actinokineospora bangkokensis TaxID=1193682 RepID=A0A1Q9LJ98_9PSEU|nr:hypothetical protein [Actinokineospora bangkokensis]OLR92075.1 hypothetical protein BJP25_22230 [Actinokineospora bangkokensis]